MTISDLYKKATGGDGLQGYAGVRGRAALFLALAVCGAMAASMPDGSAKNKRKPKTATATLTALAGQSITITSATPVTWSLAGSGSLSNQTSTSVVYTAPASVVPQNIMDGCQVLPNDAVYNTRVDSLPLDPNSSAELSTIAGIGSGMRFETSWGISYADTTTPTRTLLTYYDSVSHPGFPVPTAYHLKRESGNQVGLFGFIALTGAGNPDHHVLTVRRNDCHIYESYNDLLNGALRVCRDGTAGCNASSAVDYAQTSYDISGGGTDAAGLPLAPLTVHLDEWKSGAINHALRFTECTGCFYGGIYTWPATATAGGNYTCNGTSVYCIQLGSRLRLNSSFNITNTCNSGNSAIDGPCTTLLTALKQYGMFNADTGSTNAITLGSDVFADSNLVAAMGLIQNAMHITDFQVVNESSFEISPTSSKVNPGNGYQTPVNYATVTATPSSGSPVATSIALYGAGIGLDLPNNLPVEAGSYSFQIPYWISPSTAPQTVNWTLASGVGSVTSAGVYTPPTSTAGGASAVLKGTSAADSNIFTYLFLTILPAGTSPTGSIRIDSGSSSATTDGNGNVWQADPGMDEQTGDDGDAPWKSTDPLRTIYQTRAKAGGNDLRSTYAVPNGNYKVHLLFGTLTAATCSVCGSWPGIFDVYSFGPQILETQGTAKLHAYDYAPSVGYLFSTPASTYIPAKVTDNFLRLGVLSLAPDTAYPAGKVSSPYTGPNFSTTISGKISNVNGIEIVPDTSAPHWAIDTQQQTTIGSGQTFQPFYVIDWYTGVNDPVWSITNGPPGASINASTGVLSLASGTYFKGQPIVVQASDGTYTATTTVYTTGATQYGLGITKPPAPANHYSFKRTITIDHTKVGSADLTNFPVVLNENDSGLATVAANGHVQNANGYDIILCSDAAGSNPLAWEVERYDGNAGVWIAHVKIPTLSHTTDTVIYMFYGNPAITTSQQTASAVWDANYTGVYHLTGLTADSTANGRNVTANVGVTTAAGQIAGGGFFTASSGYHLEVPVSVLNASAGTISAWVNTAQAATSSAAFQAAEERSTNGNRFLFSYWSGSAGTNTFGWLTSSYDDRLAPSINLGTNAWHYLVYTWNSTGPSQSVYLDGAVVGTPSTSAFHTFTFDNTSVWLGASAANPSSSWSGGLDEFRFSKIARAANWVAAEYANQWAPVSFSTMGAEAGN